ncbi:acetate kinase [Paulownia witches'-broom phytoplasma]|uniref:Acetate kinase n=1 Tax=Paulownia witches'-broom phytoplasma TaxID=39647 RepID=A0ABX8TQV8_9MOLU|nr:acetate kinase [Paulownia witches'-broom phytoplasma]QYC30961.1 acetate kinase [Paulownia witches'-broom phytoplasma]GLH60690.1 acetate kinase [Paulownia witches'-broom phytoplasma]
MKIMSVNSGSSSLKFQLLEMPQQEVIVSGLVERIGSNQAVFTMKTKDKKNKQVLEVLNHQTAVELLLDALIQKKVINTLEEIEGVGHRVVQGGEIFSDSAVLTEKTLAQIESLCDLAPLHNPANIISIKAFQKVLPQVFQVAVFDTTFHQSMPAVNFLYATPYYWYQKYQIRKYGAHGTSYKYITEQMQQILGKKNAKIIICHAGNGVSLCAVDSGKSVDTSMGFTPLEGVPMGTRSGNIDPAVVKFIAEKENKTVACVIDDLNKKSGYLGVSGISNDTRDILASIKEGNQQAILSHDIQVKRIVDYIASYYVLLKGVDALVFTAGIGENSSFFRSEIIKRLSILGIKLDEEKNKVQGKQELITTFDSAIKAFVVPTNEELAIAQDVLRLQQNQTNQDKDDQQECFCCCG